MMPNEAFAFTYRCKMCGAEFQEGVTNYKIAEAVLFAAARGSDLNILFEQMKWIGMPPTKSGVHICPNGNLGLCKLIGVKHQ
jgi:hypothetical protein